MKFLANPDKFIFSIGVGVVGFLLIFSYMILNQFFLLIPVLVVWIAISYYLAKKNYVMVAICENKFIVKSMKKQYEFDFEDVDYITEFSNYTNPLKEKKYELKVSNRGTVDDKILSIENRTFSKWILKQEHIFIIKKRVFFD